MASRGGVGVCRWVSAGCWHRRGPAPPQNTGYQPLPLGPASVRQLQRSTGLAGHGKLGRVTSAAAARRDPAARGTPAATLRRRVPAPSTTEPCPPGGLGVRCGLARGAHWQVPLRPRHVLAAPDRRALGAGRRHLRVHAQSQTQLGGGGAARAGYGSAGDTGECGHERHEEGGGGTGAGHGSDGANARCGPVALDGWWHQDHVAEILAAYDDGERCSAQQNFGPQPKQRSALRTHPRDHAALPPSSSRRPPPHTHTHTHTPATMPARAI